MIRNMSRDKRFSARAIEGYRAGPALDGLQVRKATAEGVATEILMYDSIGASFWDDGGIMAVDVIAALASAGGAPVTVRINSPGGDVFEGLAIYNTLLGYAGTVSVIIDGIAASAASVIALAGTTVTMQDASLYMIHNSSTMAVGTRHDMTAQADVLGKIDATLAGIYAAKTGMTPEAVCALLDAETWMTSAEAASGGFVDSVLPAPEKAKAAPKAAAAPIIVAEAEPDTSAARRRRLRLVSAD